VTSLCGACACMHACGAHQRNILLLAGFYALKHEATVLQPAHVQVAAVNASWYMHAHLPFRFAIHQRNQHLIFTCQTWHQAVAAGGRACCHAHAGIGPVNSVRLTRSLLCAGMSRRLCCQRQTFPMNSRLQPASFITSLLPVSPAESGSFPPSFPPLHAAH